MSDLYVSELYGNGLYINIMPKSKNVIAPYYLVPKGSYAAVEAGKVFFRGILLNRDQHYFLSKQFSPFGGIVDGIRIYLRNIELQLKMKQETGEDIVYWYDEEKKVEPNGIKGTMTILTDKDHMTILTDKDQEKLGNYIKDIYSDKTDQEKVFQVIKNLYLDNSTNDQVEEKENVDTLDDWIAHIDKNKNKKTEKEDLVPRIDPFEERFD